MMKNKLCPRVCIAALVLILLFNALSFAIYAEGSTTVVEVNVDRFLTDALYVSDGVVTVDSAQNAVIEFVGGSPSVTMDISSRNISSTDNSLRIVLDNASLCETMKIDYMYENVDGILVTRSTECSMVKGNGAREYIIPMESLHTMTSLKLSFEGAARGSISIVAIGAVSYYHDGRSYCGELSKSEYDPISQKAHISGTVSWETVSRCSGGKIVVYSLKQGESAEDIKNPDGYIESRDISLNYDITIGGIKTVQAYSGYFVAVLTADGEILPIAPEFYLTSRPLTPGEENAEVGFKGIDTYLYGGAIEGGSSVAYVDVYLNRLFSYDENGFQYIVDGAEYYVDKEYVSELDKVINAYHTEKTDVYLRFLVDRDGYGKLFWKSDASDKAKYYAVDIYDENVFSQFVVYGEYVISRYSGENMGNVRGVVLGRALDLAEINNYCGNYQETSRYAEKIAKTAASIKKMLDKYGQGKEIILPFSGAGCAATQPILNTVEGRVYSVNILASSILKYFTSYNLSVSELYFMLEGDASPIAEEKSETAEGGIEPKKTTKNVSVYAPLLQCTEFKGMLELLSSEHDELPNKFIYCWYASGESPANNYIYNYNIAASLDCVRSFVLALSETEDKEREVFGELRNAYKFADTDKNAEVSGEAIKKLGFAKWNDIVESFNAKKMVKRNLYQRDLNNTIPASIKGSYKMWNFEHVSGATGWYALYGCDDISIHTASEGMPRMLKLVMSELNKGEIGAEYGCAVYSQQNLLKVSGISGLSFDVFVPKSSQEKIYEILITVESAVETVEFSGVVFSGSEATLYADIENIDTVRSIKLNARELSSSEDESFSIYIKNISIHSGRYSDSELERMVLSGNLTDSIDDRDGSLENKAFFVSALVIVLSVVLVWGIWLAFRFAKKI